MRTAGGVLGIIGSIAGFFLAGFGFLIGVLGVAASRAASDAYNQVQADPTASALVGSQGKDDIAQGAKAAADLGTWAAWAAGGSGILAILCVAGLIGGIMAFFKPPIGAILMAVAGVGGVVIANVFWSFSGFFLILGAVLAFLGTFQKTAPQVQMQPAGAPGYYPPQQAYPQQGYYPPQQDYRQPQSYPQQQVYQQPQPYYPQQQPQQGFPPAPQYGQPNPQPQQGYYPQQQQGFPPAAQGGQQQYNPQPKTAPDSRQVVPPQDNTRLN